MGNQFQAFTIKFKGRARAIVTPVGVSQAFDPASTPVPPPTVLANALWDTGASGSVISSSLAQQLKLTPVGKAKISHAGGVSDSLKYIVNLALPNKVGIQGVIVSEFPDSTDQFKFIIGMDIITLGDFSITNVAGQTAMSFRMPSSEVIDYVAEHNRTTAAIQFAGVGRNDPCPCNSGAKFKKCHGASGMPIPFPIQAKTPQNT